MKHDNFENPCRITIFKGKGDNYTLRYEDEGYEFYCSKVELLEELAEHLTNMKGANNENRI